MQVFAGIEVGRMLQGWLQQSCRIMQRRYAVSLPAEKVAVEASER